VGALFLSLPSLYSTCTSYHTLLGYQSQGFGDVYLFADKRRDEFHLAIVLNASDRPHLFKDIQRECEHLLLCLRLSDVLHVRAEYQADKENDQAPVWRHIAVCSASAALHTNDAKGFHRREQG
jgi:hypothetical protein